MDAAQARILLGVKPGSGPDQVDQAFRSLAARHHPDRGGDPARFRVLVDARNTLRKPGPDRLMGRGDIVIIRHESGPQRLFAALLRRYRRILGGRADPRVR